ncbi:MAG: MFS transporter [Synergistales bacterium]|nr:MFS transporter [Synergistales bacterium]
MKVKGMLPMGRQNSSIPLCVAAFFQMVGVGLIVALLPSRVIDLSGSMGQVGYLASAFAVPFVLLQLPVGHLGDRYGFKPFLMAGYLIAAMTGLLYFRAENVWSLLGGRILQGIGEIPVWALAPALLSLIYPLSKGEAIGKYNASIHLGLTVGSLLSVFVYTVWRGNEAFLLYAVCGLTGAVIVGLFVREPFSSLERSTLEAPTYGKVFHALKEIRRPAIYAGVCLYGGGYGVFLTVIPGVLLSRKGFAQSEVGAFFALFYIAISFAQVMGGRISDRRGRDNIMYIGLLMVAAGLAPFMWLNKILVFVFLFLASCGLGMFCVSSMVLLNDAVPDSLKGSISGVFYLLWGIGFFLVPPLIASTGGFLGYGPVFLLSAGMFLLELMALRRDPGMDGEV